MISSQLITTGLGFLGLVPFVIPAWLVVAGSGHADLSASIAETYAFGIICFLAGSWWGMVLSPGHRAALLLSNLYFLAAFFIFLFALPWWPLAAAVLLIGIFVAELNASLFPAFADHYRKMRTALTLIASASMLAIHLAR
jgi:hypothetical protein